MVLLENDVFLSELIRKFQRAKSSGSVSITMKKYDGRTKPHPRPGRKPLPDPTEYTCLMRATLKKKTISTIIHAKDVNKFQLAFAGVLRGNLDGLKKLRKKINVKATQ